jgi:hypothetical protein
MPVDPETIPTAADRDVAAGMGRGAAISPAFCTWNGHHPSFPMLDEPTR